MTFVQRRIASLTLDRSDATEAISCAHQSQSDSALPVRRTRRPPHPDGRALARCGLSRDRRGQHPGKPFPGREAATARWRDPPARQRRRPRFAGRTHRRADRAVPRRARSRPLPSGRTGTGRGRPPHRHARMSVPGRTTHPTAGPPLPTGSRIPPQRPRQQIDRRLHQRAAAVAAAGRAVSIEFASSRTAALWAATAARRARCRPLRRAGPRRSEHAPRRYRPVRGRMAHQQLGPARGGGLVVAGQVGATCITVMQPPQIREPSQAGPGLRFRRPHTFLVEQELHQIGMRRRVVGNACSRARAWV